jgi:hypothetical protein
MYDLRAIAARVHHAEVEAALAWAAGEIEAQRKSASFLAGKLAEVDTERLALLAELDAARAVVEAARKLMEQWDAETEDGSMTAADAWLDHYNAAFVQLREALDAARRAGEGNNVKT